MTPNIRKKRIMINVTLRMFGTALIKARIATFRPSFRPISLSTRNALKDLKLSDRVGVREKIDTTMIIKSSLLESCHK